MTRYISAAELLVIHALVVDATGGSHGVRDAGLLASITERPQARFGGKELHNDIYMKTAVLVEAAVKYHVFVDGNKRTALAAGGRFLFLNGYELTASNRQAEEAIFAVAEKRLDEKALAAWFRAHTKRTSSHKK